MSQRIWSFLTVTGLLIVAGALVFPMSSQAASKGIAYDLYNPNRLYGDEKQEIVNPTTRCVTTATKKLRISYLNRAFKDAETTGAMTTPEGLELFEAYLEKLDRSWGAMTEPYCGFGAFGAKAAINSYDKTITRTRNEFLAAMKKIS